MNVVSRSIRMIVPLVALMVAPALGAAQRERFSGADTKAIEITPSQVQEVMSCFEEKGYTLGEALDKAEDECDGTPIMALPRLVSPQQFARAFDEPMEDHWGEHHRDKDKKILIEVACAKPDRGQLELVAVCPESDEAHRLTRGFGMSDTRNVGFEEEEYDRAPYGRPYRGDADERWSDFDRDDEYTDRARDNRFGSDDRWFDRRGNERLDIAKGSKLIGATVRNHNDEEIGEIEDIAIAPQTGRIRYVVVGAGGFLGIGEKYFAIPWMALRRHDDHTFLLNVDRRSLERMQGFDRNNWPATANRDFMRMQGGDEFEDEGDWERRGFMTGRRGTQMASYIVASRARVFAKALQDNNFELSEAIAKGEQHTGGKAVIAKCAFSGQRQLTGYKEDQNRNYDQAQNRNFDQDEPFGRNEQYGSGRDVVVEVACFKPGETTRATVVCISPSTGEVVSTREMNLSQTRRTRDSGGF